MYCRSTGKRICTALLRWQTLTTTCQKTCWNFSSLPFSTTPGGTVASSSKEVNKPLKQWTFVVNPFSTVRVHLACNISVRPLDVHAFPEANRAFITVHGTSIDQGVKLDNFHVQYDDQNKELLILAHRVNSSVSVELTAPVKSDLYITTQGKGNVLVKKMECDICKIQTEIGDCALRSVKSHRVDVQCYGGNVTGVGTIHGNVDISVHGHGAVDLKKLQGSFMNVSTEHGPLKVKAIYAESSSVSSSSGRIQLGHVHGDATVKNVSGDVIVDGSNGHLMASSHSGDIDAYVGDSGSAEIHSQEGVVCVRVPSSLKAGVQLCGASVDLSPDVVLLGAESSTTNGQTTVTGHVNAKPQVEQWIKAQSVRGAVRLKMQSWFESLKLGS